MKAVATIRARGGEVVFVRPPSDRHLRVNEEAQVPKAKGWDALLRNTHASASTLTICRPPCTV